jgi:tetratricopeptide (TPR) repeat protein
MAVGEYTRAIGVNPNYTDAYFKRGYSYEKLDQDQNAISDYNKAIQLDPDYALAYNNRGSAYHSQTPHQYQLAINDYTKSIQLDGNNDAMAYNNRSLAYRALGQPTLADADKTMACSLNSQYC